MSAQTYEFSMEMTCEGCSGAARRVLGKLGERKASFPEDPDFKFRAVVKTFEQHLPQVTQLCTGSCNDSSRLSLVYKVSNIDTDLAAQKVNVTSTLSSDELLETLQKTGKTVSFIGVKN